MQAAKLERQLHLFGNPPHSVISIFIQVDYVSSSHPFVAVHFILECGAKLEAEAITISTAARCPFLGPEYIEVSCRDGSIPKMQTPVQCVTVT